jgi:hypothetical protein
MRIGRRDGIVINPFSAERFMKEGLHVNAGSFSYRNKTTPFSTYRGYEERLTKVERH